jgi:hypothetical protein
VSRSIVAVSLSRQENPRGRLAGVLERALDRQVPELLRRVRLEPVHHGTQEFVDLMVVVAASSGCEAWVAEAVDVVQSIPLVLAIVPASTGNPARSPGSS